MLHLDAWMMVQSRVEKYHRCNVKNNDYLTLKLTNIWHLFLKVLDIIIKYQVQNYLVNSNQLPKGILEDEMENDVSGDEFNEEQ